MINPSHSGAVENSKRSFHPVAGRALRILLVSNLFPSTARPYEGSFVRNQLNGLLAAGIQAELFYINRKEKGRSVYWRFQDDFRRKLNSYSPDLIHVAYGGVMAEQITRMVRDRPVVVSFCGSDLLGMESSGWFTKISARWGIRASRQAVERASAIHLKSENLRSALPSGVNPQKISVIPSGIDLREFFPRNIEECRKQLGWDSRKFHVLFCANNDLSIKSYDFAAESVAKLQKRGIDVEMHILKSIPYSQVPYWINAAHLLLLTSRHEGSPNIVKESIACGRPIVSVDVGDVRERVTGVTHCHIVSRNSDEICENMLKIAQLGDVTTNGPQHTDGFSIGPVTQRLLTIYQSAIAEFKKG